MVDTVERDDLREHRSSAERSEDQNGSEATQEDRAHGNKARRRWPLIILGIIVVLTIVGGVVYWLMTRELESTDDAYTEGNAVPSHRKSPATSLNLNINDNTIVKAGNLLFKIDPRDYITARDQAQADLSLAQSQLASAEVNLEITRIQSAGQTGAGSGAAGAGAGQAGSGRARYNRQRAVDPRATTQTNIDQATAQLKTETATVRSARRRCRSPTWSSKPSRQPRTQ